MFHKSPFLRSAYDIWGMCAGDIYLLAQLQEPHHLQRLFDIGDLLAQALAAALRVHLHELVLGDHLLEGAESGLDFLAGRDVVADIVDEWGDGDPARVGLCCYRAVGGVSFLDSVDAGMGLRLEVGR